MKIATYPQSPEVKKEILKRMSWSYSRDLKEPLKQKEDIQNKPNYGGILLNVLNWRGRV